MIISVNSNGDKGTFEGLLERSLYSLHEQSKKQPKKYLSLLGRKLEQEVVDILNYNAKGTDFESSIELISGQRFPDIIAKKYYGIEVKTTNKNHWTSTGSSIAEGTRVDGIKRIYMLFGKMCNPIEFKCRPYDECLSDVVVTHSPRYLINMDLGNGETFFDKINVTYDDLRNQDDPIKVVVDYYRKNLKEGEGLWWTGAYTEKVSNPIIRFWDSVSRKDKDDIRTKAFCLFPELLSNRQDKFNQFSMWLCIQNSIMCTNVRDLFTAGGQETICVNNTFYKVPKIIKRLYESLDDIKTQLYQIDDELLSQTWGCCVAPSKKMSIWKTLVIENDQTKILEQILNC